MGNHEGRGAGEDGATESLPWSRQKFCDRFNLSYDVLRRTFTSMFVAKFPSIGEAAIQAGNSESIIRRHYLDSKSTEEGAAFCDIMPKHAASAGTSDAPSPTALAA